MLTIYTHIAAAIHAMTLLPNMTDEDRKVLDALRAAELLASSRLTQ